MEGFKVGRIVLLGRVSDPSEDRGFFWRVLDEEFEHVANAEAYLEEKGIPGEEYCMMEVAAGPVLVEETTVKKLNWGDAK